MSFKVPRLSSSLVLSCLEKEHPSP
ncbi:unnamed protein product, partial [Rotaria sp. Silwood2]